MVDIAIAIVMSMIVDIAIAIWWLLWLGLKKPCPKDYGVKLLGVP